MLSELYQIAKVCQPYHSLGLVWSCWSLYCYVWQSVLPLYQRTNLCLLPRRHRKNQRFFEWRLTLPAILLLQSWLGFSFSFVKYQSLIVLCFPIGSSVCEILWDSLKNTAALFSRPKRLIDETFIEVTSPRTKFSVCALHQTFMWFEATSLILAWTPLYSPDIFAAPSKLSPTQFEISSCKRSKVDFRRLKRATSLWYFCPDNQIFKTDIWIYAINPNLTRISWVYITRNEEGPIYCKNNLNRTS